MSLLASGFGGSIIPTGKLGHGWEPTVNSTCVESGGEIALLDPFAPPEDAKDIWSRLDAPPLQGAPGKVLDHTEASLCRALNLGCAHETENKAR
jgi:hypothetical protein